MSKLTCHITLLIAVASVMLVSCQKEVSGDTGARPSAQKLSKAYYWYDGDTTGIPDYVDTIYYTAGQISKVSRLGFHGDDPETYEFQYNPSKQISKILNRFNGSGYDYMFHYSPAGRLDSLVLYEVDNGIGRFIHALTLEYAGNEMRKALSYYGDPRVLEDSVRYYRSNNKLDSFTTFHLVDYGAEPGESARKYSGNSVASDPYSDIISSGYILTHSYDPVLSTQHDNMIHQFLNPKDLLLRNLRNHYRGKFLGAHEDPINFNYTFTPSNLVKSLVIEYVDTGGNSYEAYKFEYLK